MIQALGPILRCTVTSVQKRMALEYLQRRDIGRRGVTKFRTMGATYAARPTWTRNNRMSAGGICVGVAATQQKRQYRRQCVLIPSSNLRCSNAAVNSQHPAVRN
jgi:hypothetical protein